MLTTALYRHKQSEAWWLQRASAGNVSQLTQTIILRHTHSTHCQVQ